MDKYEFNIKVEQIKKLVGKSDYETAMKIADTIDWRRVRNTNLLSMVAMVYEKNEDYEEAREILLLAFERAPIGKRLLYKLAELALKEDNIDEAEAYYREFSDLAGDDPRQQLLRYMILKAKGAPAQQLIHSLESYTSQEIDDKWLYELAELYSLAGLSDRCVETCDKIMLMFGLGKYVDKAMELKILYAPLTTYQMDLVENRDKYEAKLRAVEQEYGIGGSRINVLEQDEEYYDDDDNQEMTMQEEPDYGDIAATMQEAEVQEGLAREMSRMTYEESSAERPYRRSDRTGATVDGGRSSRPARMNPGYGDFSAASGETAAGEGIGGAAGGAFAGTVGGAAGAAYAGGVGGAAGAAYAGGAGGAAGAAYAGDAGGAAGAAYGGADSAVHMSGNAERLTSGAPRPRGIMRRPEASGEYRSEPVVEEDSIYGGGSEQQMNRNMGNIYGQKDEASAAPGSREKAYGESVYREADSGEAGYNESAPAGYARNQSAYKETGYDEAGYDEAGYDGSGYDRSGYDEAGYDGSGYDGSGYDEAGYDEAVHDGSGYGGSGYDEAAHDRSGYDGSGYDGSVHDGSGYGGSGYDEAVHDRSGYNEAAHDRSGYDEAVHGGSGYDGSGYNEAVHDGSVHDECGYGGSECAESTHNESAYDKSAHDGSVYDEAVHNKSAHDGSAYDEAVHNKSAHDESEYDEAVHDDFAHDESVYDESAYDESVHAESARGESAHDESAYDDSAYGKAAQEEAVYGEPGYGESEAAFRESNSAASGGVQNGSKYGELKANQRARNISEKAENDGEDFLEIEDMREEAPILNHLMIEARMPEKGLKIAVEALKQIHKETGIKNPVAKITGEKLSRRGVFASAEKLAGKDLIIEEAGDLSQQALKELYELMNRDTSGMLVILIDNPKQMENLHRNYPRLACKFECIGSGEENDSGEEFIPSVAPSQETRQAMKAQEARQAVKAETAAAKAAVRPLYPKGGNVPAGRQTVHTVPEAVSEPYGRPVYEDELYDAGMHEADSHTEKFHGTDSHDNGGYDGGVEEEAHKKKKGLFHDRKKPAYEELEPEESHERDNYAEKAEKFMSDRADNGQGIHGEEMDLDEFAQYACRYANEIDCSITGKSMLALYERIEVLEEDGEPLTRKSAESLIEEAADRAEKPSIGKRVKGIFSSKYDKDGLLILKEEHFIN